MNKQQRERRRANARSFTDLIFKFKLDMIMRSSYFKSLSQEMYKSQSTFSQFLRDQAVWQSPERRRKGLYITFPLIKGDSK